MKVCSLCGDTYKDHVDFCFNDGEVLLLADAETATAAMLESDLDAPLPRRVQPQQQAGQGPNRATPAPAPTSGSAATPILEPRVARPPNGEPVPSANLPTDGSPDADDAAVEGVAAVAAVAGAQGTQPAHALSSHATVPPMESPVRTVTPAGPPPSAQPTLPPSPQSAATPMLAEPREVMRVAPVPGAAPPAASANDTVTAPLVRPPPRRDQAKTTPLAVPRASPIPGQRLGGQAATLPPEPATDRSNLLMVGAVFAFGVVALPGAALLGVAYFVLVTGEWGAPNQPLSDKASVATIEPVPVAPAPSSPAPVDAQVDPDSLPEPGLGPDAVQVEPEPEVLPDGMVQIQNPEPEVEPPVPVQPQPARPSAPLQVVFALTPEDAVVRMEDLRDAKGVQLTARVLDGSSFRMEPGETCTFVVTAPGYDKQTITYPGDFRGSLYRQVTLHAVQTPAPPPAPRPNVKAMVVAEKGTLEIDGNPIAGGSNSSVTLPAGEHTCVVISETRKVEWKCVFDPNVAIIRAPPP